MVRESIGNPSAMTSKRLGTLSSNLLKKTHPKTLPSQNTFVQKHFPKTLLSKTISSKTEDNSKT